MSNLEKRVSSEWNIWLDMSLSHMSILSDVLVGDSQSCPECPWRGGTGTPCMHGWQLTVVNILLSPLPTKEQSGPNLPILHLSQACPADDTIDNGWCHHRRVWVPQKTLSSKWPQPPQQEASSLALLVQGIFVVSPVHFNQRTWSSQSSRLLQEVHDGVLSPKPGRWANCRGSVEELTSGHMDDDQSFQNWPTLTHKSSWKDEAYTFYFILSIHKFTHASL